ncbi:hypothetical protein MASR2M78_16160 [Treponema sp.]
MKRTSKSLLIILFITVLGSCGIDTYIYMKPVNYSTVNWDALNKQITFYLPTGQVEGYFNEYIIYYRLYHSDINKSLSIRIDEFSDISPQLFSDYSRINPYTTNSDSAPILLQSLFESTLKYAMLTFATKVTSSEALSSITTVGNPLDKLLENEKVTIDFNLLASSLVHPTLSIGTASYRILRSEVSGLIPSRDFLYSSSIAGDDVSNTSKQYVYVSFYIVAKGVDDSGTVILSNATFLGVLQLP